jgi:aryl-alcohol dehydrogenase-like predicted oxidoreductase
VSAHVLGRVRIGCFMIETSEFGRTGHFSSRVIFGAAAIGSGSQNFADGILETVRAAGINHIDTAASYGDSELRLTDFLHDHRDEVFLATKTGERSGSAARAELERSLQRLGVAHVDLVQLHNLVEDDEWAVAHGPGGAVEALARAQSEGLVRHIGVTGHGLRIPAMHLRSLAEFEFASVLFPYNYSLLKSPDYLTDVAALKAECVRRGVAMQTIKSIARRRWPDGSQKQYSWYEPLDDADAIGRAVRFVLSEPGLFLNSSSDARQLPAIIHAAQAPTHADAPTPAELEADSTKFGIAPLFDGRELERI